MLCPEEKNKQIQTSKQQKIGQAENQEQKDKIDSKLLPERFRLANF